MKIRTRNTCAYTIRQQHSRKHTEHDFEAVVRAPQLVVLAGPGAVVCVGWLLGWSDVDCWIGRMGSIVRCGRRWPFSHPSIESSIQSISLIDRRTWRRRCWSCGCNRDTPPSGAVCRCRTPYAYECIGGLVVSHRSCVSRGDECMCVHVHMHPNHANINNHTIQTLYP